jgi:hypothetical protein
MFRMEKLYATRRWEKVELTVGDTYAAFGRGVVLNVIKNTGIDLDTSIRGARGAFRIGTADFTLVTGLTNPQDVSMFNPNRGITKDQGHMVSGARVEVFDLRELGLVRRVCPEETVGELFLRLRSLRRHLDRDLRSGLLLRSLRRLEASVVREVVGDHGRVAAVLGRLLVLDGRRHKVRRSERLRDGRSARE